MGNAQDAELFKPSKDKTWKAYCAIDVGAISCGYAYSFDGVKHTWMNRNWAESLGYFSQRAPSAILYDRSGNPDAFGFEACEKYMSMSKEEVKQVHFAYDGLLNVTSRDIGLETYTKDEETGSEYSDDSDDNQATHTAAASDTASKTYRTGGDTKSEYADDSDDKQAAHTARKGKPPKSFIPSTVLKSRCDIALLLAKHCKNEIEAKYKHYKETPDEIEWIILVPMTWDIKQKQDFRKTVETEFSNHFVNEFNSGRYKLKLVTSTEALWFASTQQETFKNLLKKGSKKEEKAVVFIHSGGTMTEISIHKKAAGIQPVEIVSLPTGGRLVNNIFEERLLFSVQNERFIKECKEQYGVAWLDLVLKFEAARKAIRYREESNVSIDINYGFSEAYNKITGNKLSEVMPQRDEKDLEKIILSKTGKLILNGKVTKHMCENVMQLIYQALEKAMANHKLKYCGILMTGGFAESTFAREFLCYKQETKEMTTMQLFTPENSTSLLTIGAIASAKQKSELGHSIAVMFYAKHKEGKFTKVMGQNTADTKVKQKIFPIMAKGQTIEVGKCFEFGPIPALWVDHDNCICVDVIFIPETLKIIKPTSHYLPEYYTDRVTIDTLRIHVPHKDLDALHNLNFVVVCDINHFKVTVILPTSKPKKAVSLMCEYMPQKWIKREKYKVKFPKKKEQEYSQPQEGSQLEANISEENEQVPKPLYPQSYMQAIEYS